MVKKLKDTLPAGAKLRRDEDERLEGAAMQMATEMPTNGWPDARILWRHIDVAHPSTRRRILGHLLKVCANRGDAAPLILSIWIDKELRLAEQPRNRIHDAEKFLKKAAEYEARNPGSSREKIAAGIGLPEPRNKREKIADLQSTKKYKKYYDEEKLRSTLEVRKAANKEDLGFTINGVPVDFEVSDEELERIILTAKNGLDGQS